MIALFINILPVRVRIASDGLLHMWLKEIQDQQSELDQFAYSSLLQIQEWSGVPWNRLLFDSLLVFENYLSGRVSSAEQDTAFRQHTIYAASRTSYPLTVIVHPGEELHLHIAYNDRHFTSNFIERVAQYMSMLLEYIAQQVEEPVHIELAALNNLAERDSC